MSIACAVSAACLTVPSMPAYARQGGGGGAGAVPQPQAPPAGTSDRPPRAWFDNGVASVGQTLTGNVSFGGGSFKRQPDLVTNPFGPATESSVALLSGGLFYDVDAGRASLSANYGGYWSYYPALSDDALVGHLGTVGGSIRFTERTTLTGTQGFYYEPPFARSLQGLFRPGDGNFIPPPIDSGAVEERALSYTTDVELQQALTARSNISAGYRHWRYDFGGDDRKQVTHEGFARYTHDLGKDFGLGLGYRYGISQVENDPEAARIERNAIDVSLTKALALSRNTTLSLGMGTTFVTSGDDTQFLFVGDVRLDHQIGRSWNTSFYYSRNAESVEGIADIVMYDRVGADLRGQISRRVGVSAQVEGTRGDVGLGDDQNPYTGLRGAAGMAIAVSREVGVGLNYAYFRSDFTSGDFLLSPGLRNYEGHSTSASIGWRYLEFSVGYLRYRYQFNRDQSLTASVTLFAPLVARTRRPDASR